MSYIANVRLRQGRSTFITNCKSTYAFASLHIPSTRIRRSVFCLRLYRAASNFMRHIVVSCLRRPCYGKLVFCVVIHFCCYFPFHLVHCHDYRKLMFSEEHSYLNFYHSRYMFKTNFKYSGGVRVIRDPEVMESQNIHTTFVQIYHTLRRI